ncbi:MAG: SAM-dependent methyltransferase [Gemmatimonadota bacterium]
MGDGVGTLDSVELEPTAVLPNALRWRPPADIRLYLAVERAVARMQAALSVSFVGLSLGALTERRRYAIDRVYYDRERMYHTARYNEQGLFEWERQAVDKYFGGCRSIVVASAGGGREVIALRRMGLEAVGFECHADLAVFANSLLERLGLNAIVHTAARDQCPALGVSCDGAILGWGGYMLIRSRARREHFLRGIRRLLPLDAPLLLSFMVRPRSRRFALAAKVGNVCRFAFRGNRVEVGDYLVPNYVHFFTRAEIEQELESAGFRLAFYSPTPYGHAVAHAI